MTIDNMGNEFDQALLKILREGRRIMDKNGEVQQVEASAADLQVIRQRLKDCGVTSVPTQGSPIANIVEQMSKTGFKLHDLDDSDDSATA